MFGMDKFEAQKLDTFYIDFQHHRFLLYGRDALIYFLVFAGIFSTGFR